jgi:hypothetical protein
VAREHEPIRMEITIRTREGQRTIVTNLDKPKCYGHLFRECNRCVHYKGCLTATMEGIMKVAEHTHEG